MSPIRWSGVACIVLGILALCRLAFSGEKTIELEGERLVYLLKDEEVLVVSGKLTYEDITLTASEIRVFLRDERLEARGNVRVTRKDEGFTAEEVVYSWKEDWWRSKKVSSEITGKGIEGKLFFRGEVVEEKDDTMTIERARLTSCDLPEPHYYIEARRIVIYPNKKVVLYHLSYFDFGRRLFSLPSYAFFLNQKEQLPLLPMVGYSRSTGYYLTYYHNYFPNDTSFGTVELSFWEKIGWKLSITHYIDNEKENEKGKISIEYLDRKGTPPKVTAKGEYSRKFGKTLDLSSNFSYAQTVGENDAVLSAQALLTYTEKKLQSKLTASYTGNSPQESSTLSATWVTSYDLGGVTAKTQVVFREDARFGAYTDEDLQYEIALQKAAGVYTYTLRYTGHEDLEGDVYTGDFVRFVRKIPELEVVRKKERLGKSDFTWQAGVLLGHYAEEDTGVMDERLHLFLDLEGKSTLAKDTTLASKLRFEQNFYGNGFARYVFSGSLAFEKQLSEAFRLSLSYNRAGYAGATPFRFDYTTPRTEFLGLGVVYEEGPWSVRFESGYDTLSGVFSEGILKVSYEESAAKSFEVRGSYDFNEGTFTGVVVELAWPLSREWNVGLSGGWDPVSGELEALRVRLTRDLHCREISLFYDRSQDTFWVEYGIKAFPGQTVKIGGE